jgi:hypothetical protein
MIRPGSVYIGDGGGGGCVGILDKLDVNRLVQGERSKDIYVIGAFLVVFALTSRGVGRLPNRPKTKNSTSFF